ncbi:MAG: GNAT family N-acetyltransferase [Propionibacteriaceae bacterium]|jgi:predicted GNAT family acetyltransferase|nr:GNAT family N-acetyltransferase [Propionibacteriaceae bacterium]
MPTVRALTPRDLTQTLALAGRHPVENVAVLAKIRASGLESAILGHDILGAFDHRGRMTGVLSHSAALQPVEATPESVHAFARYLGGLRRVGSVVGPRDAALDLWGELSRRFPGVWGTPREVRGDQPLLKIDHDPAVVGDPRVTAIDPRQADAYYEAACAMYREEIGLDPNEATGGYRRHVEGILSRREGFGLWDGRRVLFKADVSVASGDVCQLGGLWLHPEWRGQGLSEGFAAQVVRLCRRRWPVVSLYVNDYNRSALALYRRLGFVEAARFATVLW